MKNKVFKIRDFFKVDGMLFSTVRYSQGDQVEALLRYVENPSGSRESSLDGKRYKKLDFKESFQYLKQNKPRYLKMFSDSKRQIIPKTEVDKLYRPIDGVTGGLEKKVKKLLTKEGIDENKIGVTGSRLVGLETKYSDIDLVVYGVNQFNKARKAIQKLIKKGYLNPYQESDWKKAYNKRKPTINYSDFVFHEKRKNNRAIINGTPLDLLFVRNDKELPAKQFEGKRKGIKKITAKVIDDRMNYDSPAIYKIKHPELDYVVSYTHTYTGQAYNGEKITAKGIHQTGEEEVLIVGTTRQADGEYIKTTN
ncbi:nucleotidyltransferase domain-containing protein [Methanonatronarchaeum sp. AMET-Sl]|uniref:nucleotidyltransferase domain-containing protein n=1 Tax=Methanonatronarchaeum sp. AMET-Sl TaxID=3037654 RepID=UPI00244DBCFD|nr:nucleotidyltransferase domain-containing protein [Methanonatronarchaeum sp. AMET-Sl]WGI17817.1 nucleotidyltransferase domain-containing protein [Methanonatronarchaeum sp. AMET-Sl]